jgi:hypothetical protein
MIEAKEPQKAHLFQKVSWLYRLYSDIRLMGNAILSSVYPILSLAELSLHLSGGASRPLQVPGY